MRIKLLDDAGVAAESPPSQHEQIFDLSQVIRSVGEELQTNIQKANWFKLPFSHFHSIIQHNKSFFKGLLFPGVFVVSSPGAVVEAGCQECTLNSSNSPALSA